MSIAHVSVLDTSIENRQKRVPYNHVLETITESHLSTLFALATNNKDCMVFLRQFPHGSVTTDELTRRYFHL